MPATDSKTLLGHTVYKRKRILSFVEKYRPQKGLTTHNRVTFTINHSQMPASITFFS